MDRTITLLVLQRLPVYDIVHSISAVCIQWHSLLETEELWRDIYIHSAQSYASPLVANIHPKEQFKKQYRIWLNMQRGQCTRKIVPSREYGDVLHAFDKYYFVGNAGFRIYDTSQEHKCVGGSRDDVVSTQTAKNSWTITKKISCEMLRCDGRYIVALEHHRERRDKMVTIWRFADVLDGKEEPLRSYSVAHFDSVKAIDFNARSGIIVLQSTHFIITILNFETFETFYQSPFDIKESTYAKVSFALYNDQLIATILKKSKAKVAPEDLPETEGLKTLGCAKLQILDLSVPTKPRKIWSRKKEDEGEEFPFVYIDKEYVIFAVRYPSGQKLCVYRRLDMEMICSLIIPEEFYEASFNPGRSCFAIGDIHGHVRIWDVRTQDKIFEDDAFPIHISKWAVIYQLDKGIRFLHLFKDKLLVQSGSHRKLTQYDFEDTTPRPKEYPDSDDESDPTVYNFCILSVHGAPCFMVSARIYLPYWDSHDHQRKIMPREFKGQFYLGNSEDEEVTLYTYIHENVPDVREAVKKGRETLLSLGVREYPELAKKLLDANFVPDLAVYNL